MNMDAIKTEYQAELSLVENSKQLGDFWAKYLGKGGKVTKVSKKYKDSIEGIM